MLALVLLRSIGGVKKRLIEHKGILIIFVVVTRPGSTGTCILKGQWHLTGRHGIAVLLLLQTGHPVIVVLEGKDIAVGVRLETLVVGGQATQLAGEGSIGLQMVLVLAGMVLP